MSSDYLITCATNPTVRTSGADSMCASMPTVSETASSAMEIVRDRNAGQPGLITELRNMAERNVKTLPASPLQVDWPPRYDRSV